MTFIELFEISSWKKNEALVLRLYSEEGWSPYGCADGVLHLPLASCPHSYLMGFLLSADRQPVWVSCKV